MIYQFFEAGWWLYVWALLTAAPYIYSFHILYKDTP